MGAAINPSGLREIAAAEGGWNTTLSDNFNLLNDTLLKLRNLLDVETSSLNGTPSKLQDEVMLIFNELDDQFKAVKVGASLILNDNSINVRSIMTIPDVNDTSFLSDDVFLWDGSQAIGLQLSNDFSIGTLPDGHKILFLKV